MLSIYAGLAAGSLWFAFAQGQAVLFAALHGSLRAKTYALGMGLLFGWAADRSGSLLPGILLHILNNGAVLARCLAERGTP